MEKPVNLRNTQLVFEPQNRLDLKKTAIFENILKIRGKVGYNSRNSYKTHARGSPKTFVTLPKEPTTRSIYQWTTNLKEINRFEVKL